MKGLGVKSALRKVINTLQSAGEYTRCTYIKDFSGVTLNSFLSGIAEVVLPTDDIESYATLSRYYLEHRFDLLGSGLVQIKHGMLCRGVEGHRYDPRDNIHPDAEGQWLEGRVSRGNLEESERIWRLISPDYTPIDWHLDFKSGYRWSETTWFKLVPLSPARGADIKVPWELARMQHLPQLAIAYALARKNEPGFARADMYAKEYCNQVLDFMATNPPRYGVNWRSSMDVAIRVVNWLVAYDLFHAVGAEFDKPFLELFARGVCEHLLHVLQNLEWKPDYRNNHYLANIAGLLFCSAYLPSTPLTDAVLAFAVQELMTEVGYQFHPDGSNFEVSTCYHRLSAEMVMWCTALVLGLPEEKQAALSNYDHRLVQRLKPAPLPTYPAGNGKHTHPFPEWYIDRLHRMARFTLLLTKPSGQIVQIGDNDSGRFIKLQCAWRRMNVGEAKERLVNLEGYNELPDDAPYIYEDMLDHSPLLALAHSLFGNKELEAHAQRYPLEQSVYRALCPCLLPIPVEHEEEKARIGNIETWRAFEKKREQAPHATLRIRTDAGNLREGLHLFMFADFGVYLFRSPKLYLLVRCGRQREGQRWGHAHNDQMHMELWLDGHDIIRDPGTYLYTPLPEMRDRYRSIHAHFTPAWQGKEPRPLSTRVFENDDAFQAECLYFREEGILMRHYAYGFPVYRMIVIGEEEIICTDFAEGSSANSGLAFTYAKYRPNFSPGYGVMIGEPAIVHEALQWTYK